MDTENQEIDESNIDQTTGLNKSPEVENENDDNENEIADISQEDIGDEKSQIDDIYIINKISDYKRKAKEQVEYQKHISQNIFTNNQDEEKNKENEKIVNLHNLTNQISLLHEDIKICELYKKNLEEDIRSYKQKLSENNNLKKAIINLKNEITELEKKRSIVQVEIEILDEKNEILKSINSDSEEKLRIYIAQIKSFESNIKDFKNYIEHGIKLDGIKESNIESFKNVIAELKKEKSDLENNIKELKDLESQIYDKIEFTFEKIRSEIDSNNDIPVD